MPRTTIAGIGIEYELLGDAGAQAVAITPGGRFGKDSPGIRELGELLAAQGRRVLLWDRPNCGASDISFEGENESELQAQTLTQLIRALDLGPTALTGGSAGSRVSLIAAAHDPQIVSHLVQWWISGGLIGLMMLGASYCCESAVSASMAGMEAVTRLPLWAEQVERNPRNRDTILSQDRDWFIARMEKWASVFVPVENSPVPGMSPQDFGKLTMPVLIFRGSPKDLYHPAHIAEWVHRLVPHSEMIDAPWAEDAFERRMIAAAQTGSGHFLDWPLLAPATLEFTGHSGSR